MSLWRHDKQTLGTTPAPKSARISVEDEPGRRSALLSKDEREGSRRTSPSSCTVERAHNA